MVLLSSVGLSVSMHLCKDVVMDISLTGDNTSCGADDYDCTDSSSDDGIHNEPCCSNEVISTLSCFYDNALILNVEQVVVEAPSFPQIASITIEEDTDRVIDVRPPPALPDEDLSILYQSFLI